MLHSRRRSAQHMILLRLHLAAASAMLMYQSARQQTAAAVYTNAAGFKEADPASTLVDGSSSLNACIKALVPSCLLDCITSSQNVPAMHTLHYSTAGSPLVHLDPIPHGTRTSDSSKSKVPNPLQATSVLRGCFSHRPFSTCLWLELASLCRQTASKRCLLFDCGLLCNNILCRQTLYLVGTQDLQASKAL